MEQKTSPGLCGRAFVVQLQEREHSVLKLHKECKQDKWNLRTGANPLLEVVSRKKVFCVTFDKEDRPPNCWGKKALRAMAEFCKGVYP